MRYDPTREIDAAVRGATAPLLAEIERLNEAVEAYNACARKDAATIMELRAKVTQLDADYLWISDRLNPMEQERDELRNTLGHVVGARDRAEAECIELRDHLSQANAALAERNTLIAAHQAENGRLQAVIADKQECINYWGDLCDQRERDLAEMTRCRTAADVQHARERQQGTTYPWHAVDAKERLRTVYAGPATVTLRPTYQRTDDDGPMWRPDAPFSKGDLAT
jgi:chromosome segregation ATPase